MVSPVPAGKDVPGWNVARNWCSGWASGRPPPRSFPGRSNSPRSTPIPWNRPASGPGWPPSAWAGTRSATGGPCSSPAWRMGGRPPPSRWTARPSTPRCYPRDAALRPGMAASGRQVPGHLRRRRAAPQVPGVPPVRGGVGSRVPPPPQPFLPVGRGGPVRGRHSRRCSPRVGEGPARIAGLRSSRPGLSPRRTADRWPRPPRSAWREGRGSRCRA